MEIKHLYFHSSNFEYIKLLNIDELFEPVFQYSQSDLKNLIPNEYGRITTAYHCYHLIMGNIPQKECPWCGMKPVLKKLPDVNGMDYSSYCMQCPNCGSRGPVMKINPQVQIDERELERVKALISDRYSVRLPWDHESFGVLSNG